MVAPLLADSGQVSSWIADHHVVSAPAPIDIAHVSGVLNSVLAGELAGAAEQLDVTAEELLLAALCRTVSRTLGDGVLSVDVDADNWTGRAALVCAPRTELSAADMLVATRNAVRAATPAPQARCDIRFGYHTDAPLAAADGVLLALHAHHDPAADVVVLDWCYDTRSFEAYTIEELAEQFPLALTEIASEAADA